MLVVVSALVAGCGKSPEPARAPQPTNSKPGQISAKPKDRPAKEVDLTKKETPDLKVSGQIVRISWEEKGKVSMKATAQEFSGNTISGEATLKRVNARLFSNGKQTATIVAPLVQVDENSRVLTASGGVTLTTSDPKSSIKTVKASWIKWYARDNRIVGNGGIKARGPVASIDAAAFIADTQLRSIRILSDPAEARAVIGKH